MNKFTLTCGAIAALAIGFGGGINYASYRIKNVARNAFAAGAMTGIELQKFNSGLQRQGVAFTAKEWNDLIEREFNKKVQLP